MGMVDPSASEPGQDGDMTAPTGALPQPGSRRQRYGIDVPLVPLGLAISGVFFLGLGALLWNVLLMAVAVFLFLQTALYLHASLRGKFRAWNRALDALHLKGDEDLADLGCGRGAVLTAAARRIPRGHAHGVDLFQSVDRNGLAEDVTRRNAEAEGVSEQVELHSADLKVLPFVNSTVDVVTSSLAFHLVPSPYGRGIALDEGWRLLRPGGRIVIADFRYARSYADHLRKRGATDVLMHRCGPGFWFGGPWLAVSFVTATKPDPAARPISGAPVEPATKPDPAPPDPATTPAQAPSDPAAEADADQAAT